MSYMKKEEYISKFGEEAWAVEDERRKSVRKNYYNKNREKILQQQKEAFDKNPEKKKKMLDYHKDYYTKNKDIILEKQGEHRKNGDVKKQRSEYQKQYYEKNKEKITEYASKHQKENRDKHNCRNLKYYHSKKGRANNLINQYKRQDKDSNREECTLTRSWIVDRIFSSSCVYCGDSDWEHLGCDRIDNSLPHTPENCICACGICNIEREYKEMSVDEFKKYRAANPRECDKQKGSSPIATP